MKIKAKNETSLKALGNASTKKASDKKGSKALKEQAAMDIPNLGSSVERDNLSAPRGIKNDSSCGPHHKLGATRLT